MQTNDTLLRMLIESFGSRVEEEAMSLDWRFTEAETEIHSGLTLNFKGQSNYRRKGQRKNGKG